jgi:hypothetical protein
MSTNTRSPSGPIVAGAAVILTGHWLKITRQAVLIAARSRNFNGLPVSVTDAALARALTQAMTAGGHSDVPETQELQHVQIEPTVTVRDGARQLMLSERQTRRLAPKLGGKKIGNRWLLDQAAIDEHLRGKDDTWTATA